MLHKELLRKLRMPDCLIVLGQEEGADSSKLTDYRLLVAHLILQLQGVLGLEAFYSQHLVDSLELQLVVGVMVMGADIGEGDSGEMDVAGPPFAKGLLHLLLDLHLDEVEEVVLQLASLLLGHLQVILVLPEEELTLVREVRAHPARSTLLADLLQKVTAQILHASLNFYALFDSSDFTFPLFETSVACVVLAALVRKIEATFSIAHVVAQSQVTVQFPVILSYFPLSSLEDFITNRRKLTQPFFKYLFGYFCQNFIRVRVIFEVEREFHENSALVNKVNRLSA